MSRRFLSAYRRTARHDIAITPAALDLYEAAHGHRILLELAEWDVQLASVRLIIRGARWPPWSCSPSSG